MATDVALVIDLEPQMFLDVIKKCAEEIAAMEDKEFLDIIARITPITHELRQTANESLEDHMKRHHTDKTINLIHIRPE
jgi:hypothetical protein